MTDSELESCSNVVLLAAGAVVAAADRTDSVSALLVPLHVALLLTIIGRGERRGEPAKGGGDVRESAACSGHKSKSTEFS